MNDDLKIKDEDEYMGDPELGIARAEDGETPKETHPGERREAQLE